MNPYFLFNKQLVLFFVEFIDKVCKDKGKYKSFNMRSTNFPWQLIWVPSSMLKTVVWWMVYFVAWITGNKKGWGRRGKASGIKFPPPLPLPFCTSQGSYVKKGLNYSLKNSLQRNMPASKQSRICRSNVKDVRLVQCQFSWTELLLLLDQFTNGTCANSNSILINNNLPILLKRSPTRTYMRLLRWV